ncbi:LysR family transcriptional regulator [Hoeflea sp. YIM 152468]|uniref:LysR family transcriptional regulator n=1 Tax=Hoeflea sp. YIM 152468 TaxID=3031759 RepID=UPI0023DA3165|nr:LysR family transcriptional regulator [Hoeflea sp. YIM 152468]MDF1608949.1 LysR family transcriptional regulator [Hoeflea sp. YIM 152468]
MDIRQLQYFIEIVEQGSFTRASRSLNIAQPALSLHLRNMENALGTRLLVRSHAGVVPTEAGALLARRARSILDDLARTEDDIRTLDGNPQGVVRVGLPGTISAILGLPLITAARERYPGIVLNISEAMSGFIADWMSEGRIDIAVLYSASQERGNVSQRLLEEELAVIWQGDSDCPSEMSLEGLRDTPMVLPSSAHGLRIQLNEAMRPLGISPNVAVEIDSYANIKSLVAAGFGASILPYHAVQQEVSKGTLAVSRIADPGLWRGVHLTYPANRPVARAQQVVLGLLREVIFELHASGDWAAVRLPKTDD